MTGATTARIRECLRSISAPTAGLVVASLFVARLMQQQSAFAASHPGANFGSMSWPIAMVFGLIASFGLLIAFRIGHALRSSYERPWTSAPSAARAGAPGRWKALAGIVAITLYVAAIPYVGFPLGTLVFLICWFVLAGTRKPVLVVATSVLVTLATLYMFVKVAYMPLPEGVAAFKQATIWMYRALGIF